MNIIIKYHEKTSDENQMFYLDSSKHYQIIPIEDNIKNYNTSTYTYIPLNTTPRVDLSKYDDKMVYGIFEGYGRIDGNSIFIVNTDQIDRDLKIEELLK
jgi:hypothetical protein